MTFELQIRNFMSVSTWVGVFSCFKMVQLCLKILSTAQDLEKEVRLTSKTLEFN